MKLYIKNMNIETILGVYEEEKYKRTFEVSFDIDFDAGQSADTDNISDTFDYNILEQAIVAHVSDKNYNLIERLNKDILDIALSYPQIQSCRVRIHKKACTEHSESIAIEDYRKRI